MRRSSFISICGFYNSLFVFYKFTIFIPDVADPGTSLIHDNFIAVFVIELGGGKVAAVALPGSFDDFAVGKDDRFAFSMNTESEVVMVIPDFAVAVLENDV